MEHKNKKSNIIVITILITIACIGIIETLLYYSLRKNLTLVFYDVECVEDTITDNYSEEYICTYFRLNSKYNHNLKVGDFSIFYDSKFQEAAAVVYFDQQIKTTFETYPNQPQLKVYFKVPHSVTEKPITLKYQDTEIMIGGFAKSK